MKHVLCSVLSVLPAQLGAAQLVLPTPLKQVESVIATMTSTRVQQVV